jgi:AcrR family transcriptional regulator
MNNPGADPAAGAARKSYHHGELRQALIDATRQLVRDRGEENFSLADACRAAGVSTAAPYRHFADKDEILAEIVAQGFDTMAAEARAAVAPLARGAPGRIAAIGAVYVGFALREPALFRLMFGQKPAISSSAKPIEHGQSCFGLVIEEVMDFCTRHGIAGDARMIAVELWTFVHGVASLTIDGDYQKVVPDIDTRAIMADAADRLLFSRPRA